MTALTAPIPFAALTYSPAVDDDFCDAFITDLLAHPREWRHSGRAAMAARAPGADCDPGILAEYSYRAATVWRRLGHVIDGDTQLGFRWMGCRRPRFTTLAWASQWPDVPMNVREHRRASVAREQLTLKEAL